jgi:T5SS/PEP-CTERM-associated repeat protein
MTNIIINGNFPNGLDLDNPITNPVTVTGTIDLGSSGQAGALQGEAVAAWDVTNQGSILGGTADGIDLLLGGTVTNDAQVSGVFAIEIDGSAGTVVNAGILTGGATGTGIYLADGGTVINQANAQIQSGDDGVTTQGSAAVVTNAGIINAGIGGAAVDLFAGGTVANLAGGTLTGDWGISIQGAANNSVVNDGVITGEAQSGVFLTGGTVTNQAGGTISGNWGIADSGAAGTVITSGTIIGTSGTAVTLASGFANLLVDNPGAVFNGVVDGGNASGGTVVSTLELGAASLQGTLSGLGANFIDFGNVLVDPGASWTLSGSNTLALGATLTDQGALLLNGATLFANGTETIGATAGVAASVTLTGAARWAATTLVDGGAGSGAISVGNKAGLEAGPAVLGAAAGSNGSLTITDAGSEFAAISLTVGQAGGGQLTIENQASALVLGNIDVGAAAGATGHVTVTGTQSALSNTGLFIVGDSGLATLAINAGGSVITSASVLGSGGVVITLAGGAGGSATTSAGAVIANTVSAASSSANVSGTGSYWQIDGALTVGNAGFGSLSISQGATVDAFSADLAAASGGSGVITVSGTGSALNLSGSLSVGDHGAGELSILGGGTVSTGDLTIGNANAASSGNVDVEGAGSTLHIADGGILNIGVAGGGSGILTIGTNATLTFNGTIVEAGHASFNNNGGLADPDTFEFTTASNAGLGENDYSLYLGNIGAVQVADGTGTWNAAMLLTGTSVADAADNIDNDTRGQWQLSGGGTLVINANTVDAGQVIVFEDNTDTLVIGQLVNGGSGGISGQPPVVLEGAENLLQAGGFDATIWGYRAGDKILFNNLAVVSDQIVNGNTLELLGVGNTDLGSLVFRSKAGDAPLGKTAMAAAAAQMACFASGTLIETVAGPRAVETLAVGDEVVTLLGGPGRIVWVGSRAVDCARHPRPEAVWPVRIAAGAFGENVPERELFVSPDHAVYVDNVLIPAKHLLNGTTIRQVQRRRVVYHHIELAEHNVVLAEGLPAESYLDAGERANFHGETVIRLFPDFATHSAQVWETDGAAPLVVAGPQLEVVRLALAAISFGREPRNLNMLA